MKWLVGVVCWRYLKVICKLFLQFCTIINVTAYRAKINEDHLVTNAIEKEIVEADCLKVLQINPFYKQADLIFNPGVPLSTQWGPQGYFYAIQIAQYGLSHYSKNLTERPPHVEIYDTAEERDSRASAAPWIVPKGCSFSHVYDKSRATTVHQFSAQGMLASVWALRAESLSLVDCGRQKTQ